jgi:ATP-dependent protease ClpP protease subunit
MKHKKITFNASSISLDMSQSGDHLDLFLIGCVGDWGNDIETVLYRMRQLPNLKTIDVYINSIGGSFYDGLPIFNLLQMHPAFVTTKVIGYACSMASVIMLAANEVQAAKNAVIMIHRAQGACWGDADGMMKAAEILATHEMAVMPEYTKRLKLSDAEVIALLAAETWYTSQAAFDAGLIDTIIDPIADIPFASNTGVELPDPEDDDELIAENSAQYALTNYKNIPPAVKQKLESVGLQKTTPKPSFMASLFSKKTTSKPEPDEIDMTKEELDARLKASGDELVGKVAEMLKPLLPQAEEPQSELAKLSAEFSAYKKDTDDKLAAMQAIIDNARLQSDEMDIDPSAGGVTGEGDKW